MLIVGIESVWVEAELVGGRLGCPACAGALGPWGYGRRRLLRCRDGYRFLVPRRARCRECLGTHVLLPQLAFCRRRDEVSVIGEAIVANVGGEGFRPIAARLGACPETVRGWLRRFRRRAQEIRALFTRWAVMLDPELAVVMPAGGGIADALEAIGTTARAWVLRFGPAEVWQVACRLSGGCLLSNTN
jgi:hypothetical protein